MNQFNTKMVMVLLGLSFLSCCTSRQLSDEDDIMKLSLSDSSGSDGGESIRSPAIKEWLAPNLEGIRRLLGRKYEEKINSGSHEAKHLAGAETERMITPAKSSHTHHHHHHRKRKSTKSAVPSTFVKGQQNEENNVAAKEMNTFSWHKHNEKLYDRPIFHVDYSGPKTHPPKNN